MLIFPDSLNISVTDKCNLNCQYCFVRTKSRATDGELSCYGLKKALNSFLCLPSKNKTISFGGGEPLYCFENVKKACLYLRHRSKDLTGPNINIVTNATLLNTRHINFIKENSISLTVSIDGKQKIHDFVRPFKSNKYRSSYTLIKRHIDFMLASKIKLKASLVFTPFNYKFLLSNINHLQELGFPHIDFMPAFNIFWREDDLCKIDSIFAKFSDNYVKNVNKGKIFHNFFLQCLISESNLFRQLQCNKIHLDVDNNFYLCDKVKSLPRASKREFIIGNINNGIDYKLRKRMYLKLKNELKKNISLDCSSCKYSKFCFCPLGHYIFYSRLKINPEEPLKQFCKLSRIYIKHFLAIKEKLKPILSGLTENSLISRNMAS